MPIIFSFKIEAQRDNYQNQLRKYSFNLFQINRFKQDLTVSISNIDNGNGVMPIEKLNEMLVQTHLKQKSPTRKLISNG